MGTSPPISYFSQMHRSLSLSLSLSLSHIHTSGQGIKKKEYGFWEKQKVLFLQQEDYHYGYWGISYKEWTTLTYPLSFLLVCREYVYGQSRSIKDIGLAKRMGPPLWDLLGKSIVAFGGAWFSNFNFIYTDL